MYFFHSLHFTSLHVFLHHHHCVVVLAITLFLSSGDTTFKNREELVMRTVPLGYGHIPVSLHQMMLVLIGIFVMYSLWFYQDCGHKTMIIHLAAVIIIIGSFHLLSLIMGYYLRNDIGVYGPTN